MSILKLKDENGNWNSIPTLKGDTGNGIESTVLNSDYTLTINYTDGTDYTTPSIRGEKGNTGSTGAKGDKGDKGDQGVQGERGLTGATPNLTIGTVDTLTPNDDATVNITGTAENPVLNFGIPKGDIGEVTLADLNSALIEKAPIITDTASGAIASFSDGADDLPLKSLIVDINPIQDLHGQDSPYPAGGGKNLLIQMPQKTSVINGVTWTINSDGSISANGTASGNSTFNYIRPDDTTDVVFDGDYKYIQFPFVPIAMMNIGIKITSWYSVYSNVVSSINAATGKISTMWFQIKDGQTANITFYPMIYKASESTPTAWSPYENICPISGWTEIGVEQRGVNVWDEEWESGGISSANGSKYNDNNRIRSKNFIPVKPSTKYYFAMPSTFNAFKVAFYGLDKDFLSFSAYKNNVITTPSNCYWLMLSENGTDYGTTYNHDISINYPSTDHSYHPYSGRSITIQLGQTVYGGHLDVISGVLTVDRAKYIESGQTNWEGGNAEKAWRWFADVFNPPATIPTSQSGLSKAMSDKFKATYTVWSDLQTTVGFLPRGTRLWIRFGADTELTTAQKVKEWFTTNPTEFVYELATPIEIQLTPNQVNSLLGVNNIWADSGDTTAEYRADTKLFIERLTAPDSADMIADANITSGKYFMVGNSLYKATANIANGSAIVVGTNCIRKSLSEALNEINA